MGYVLEADCRAAMSEMVDLGLIVQAVVTDGPYGTHFMNRDWDSPDTIALQPDVWRLCWELLPPGGHLAAFGGTRTYHRLACAIEDAGFEIRDTISWIYGQGFPKSWDVSKAIDKRLGVQRKVIGTKPGTGGENLNRLSRPDGNNSPDAHGCGSYGTGARQFAIELPITAPASPQARQWAGYGTALKPAHELIVLARKPLQGTVAANVLEHGTGAMNIDGCRVELSTIDPLHHGFRHDGHKKSGDGSSGVRSVDRQPHLGRWPANVAHDGSDEVLERFAQFGIKPGSPAGEFYRRKTLGYEANVNFKSHKDELAGVGYGDTGSAARFFYCAKASKKERNGSKHPTIKPVSLMRWLVRMVTPPGGLVLDPFAGSGSTGEAAHLESRDYLLIERDSKYVQDIERRLKRVTKG